MGTRSSQIIKCRKVSKAMYHDLVLLRLDMTPFQPRELLKPTECVRTLSKNLLYHWQKRFTLKHIVYCNQNRFILMPSKIQFIAPGPLTNAYSYVL